MVCGRFARRASLKGGANPGWFVTVLHVGRRLKGRKLWMVCSRFARRLSLKVGANHGWFVSVLHVGRRLKGGANHDGFGLF